MPVVRGVKQTIIRFGPNAVECYLGTWIEKCYDVGSTLHADLLFPADDVVLDYKTRKGL